jgi:hypothetical protein
MSLEKKGIAKCRWLYHSDNLIIEIAPFPDEVAKAQMVSLLINI